MKIFTVLINFKNNLFPLFFLVIFCLQISTVEAGTKTWIGGSSSAWTTPGNWTGGVPGAADDVVIGASTPNFWPIITTGVTINDLRFDSYGINISLTVTLPGSLTARNFVQEHWPTKGGNNTNFFRGTGAMTFSNLTVGAGAIFQTKATFQTIIESSVASLTATNINLISEFDNGNGQSQNYSWVDSYFTLVSGILSLTNQIITVNKFYSWPRFTVNSGAKLILSGPNALSLSTFNPSRNYIEFLAGSTVEYAGALPQIIYTDTAPNVYTPSISYSNIIFSGAGQKNVDTGNLLVSGNWTSSGGKVDLSTNNPTVNFNGASPLPSTQLLSDVSSDAAKGVYFKNVTFSNSGPKLISSGKFSVATNGLLTMAGSGTTLEAGEKLYLKSDATSNANVAAIPSGCSITGNVIVESWMKGGPGTRGFQTLTSPVHEAAGGTTYSLLLFKKNMIVTGPNTPAQTLSTLVANPGFFDQGITNTTSSSTVKFYNEPAAADKLQYLYPASIADTRLLGQGLYFYYRGDRINAITAKLTANSTQTTEAFAPTFVGIINSGDISVPLSYTNKGDSSDGYTLIGNPYPSTIDWNSPFIDKTKLLNLTIYILKKNGTFATYNGTLGTNNGTQYILPGQGFFVKSKPAGGAVLFTEQGKSTYNIPLLADRLMSIGNDLHKDSPLRHLSLTLKQDTTFSDETVIAFRDGNDVNATDEDATYFGGNNVLLTSLSADNKYLAINYMPAIKDVNEVKLYVTANLSGKYTLELSKFNTLASSMILLYDKLKDSTISMKTALTYSFEINKADATTFGSGRFKLLFKPEPLPTRILSFSARKVNRTSELSWSTASELNNEYFEIQRSADGVTFVNIGTVKGSGTSVTTSQYTFIDDKPLKSDNFYRFKPVDKSTANTVSNIVSVKFGGLSFDKESQVTIFPNPAINDLNIRFSSSFTSAVDIRIIDSSGRLVKSQRVYNVSSGTLIKQDIRSLSASVYIIEITNGKKIISRSKLIKE